MNDLEMQWCKDFIASLNGRAPSAAELYDFLDNYIKNIEDAMDDGYALGYDDAKSEYDLALVALDKRLQT